MKTNDFHTDLAFSQEASAEPFWEAVYRKAFPTFASFSANPQNNEAQHAGIDRVIVLASGQVLKVDEKKRRPRPDGREYQDVLLEYISNDQRNTPGWIEKDLPIDYLAYAFMKTQVVWLFPWLMLRKAWRENGEQWKRENRRVVAPNRGYNTIGVAVPIPELRQAVTLAMSVVVPIWEVKA